MFHCCVSPVGFCKFPSSERFESLLGRGVDAALDNDAWAVFGGLVFDEGNAWMGYIRIFPNSMYTYIHSIQVMLHVKRHGKTIHVT